MRRRRAPRARAGRRARAARIQPAAALAVGRALAVVLGGALAGCAATLLAWSVGTAVIEWRGHDDIAVEAVGLHVHASQGDRMIQVASADQHTVKPWLSARLDYSPPVVDLREEGFPLLGGRIDHLDHRPVATLVYGYRKHTIDVFVRPESAGALPMAPRTVRGFHVAHARGGGMEWLAVSDASVPVLTSFVQRLADGGGRSLTSRGCPRWPSARRSVPRAHRAHTHVVRNKPACAPVRHETTERLVPTHNVFEQSVLPHLDAGYNLARWLTRDVHDAQDVVQDACLRAMKYAGSLNGESARPWFLTIVRHAFYDWCRRNRPAALVDDDGSALENAADDESPGPEQVCVRRAESRALADAIAALPLAFREVLVLRELEELSYKEIARVADIPIGTVMSRLARARALLQRSPLLHAIN